MAHLEHARIYLYWDQAWCTGCRNRALLTQLSIKFHTFFLERLGTEQQLVCAGSPLVSFILSFCSGEKSKNIEDGNTFRSFLLRKSRLDSSRSISLPRWKYHASTKFYNFLNVREYFLKRSGSLFKRDGRIRMVNIEIINFR